MRRPGDSLDAAAREAPAQRGDGRRLAAVDIAVFRMAVAGVSPGMLADGLSRMSAADRERAASYRLEEDRKLFVAGRMLLAHALSAALGLEGWSLRTGRHGKPIVARPSGPPAEFNLAHTPGLALCAVSASGPVGIDVEAIDRPVAYERLAERHLTAGERAELASFPVAERTAAFYRFWTLKEAVSKALGYGLALPFTEIEFRLDGPSLALGPALRHTAGSWQIEELRQARYQIAVAVRRPPGRDLAIQWHSVAWPGGGAAQFPRSHTGQF